MINFFAGTLAVLGIALLYSRLFGRSLSNTLSASVFTICLALYTLSIASVPLRLSCALVMATGCICLLLSACSAVKKRIPIERMDRFTLLTYGLCALFAFTYLRRKLAIGWDEFSHWMLTLKNMFHFDSLALGELSSTEYQSYPPAIQLFEVFHLIFGDTFYEGGAYMARTMLLSSMLFAPAFHQTKSGLTAAAKFLILFVSPVAFYGSAYSMLYIDAVLGFMFAHLLWLYFSEERFDRFFVFHFALSGAVLTLVKGTGIALLALALMVMLADTVFFRRNQLHIRKKSFLLGAALMLIIPLAAMLSWNLYQRIHGIDSFWQAQSSINLESILALVKTPLDYQKQTLSFFRYSYKNPMTIGVLPVSFARYPFYFIGLCVFAGLCARHIKRGTLLGVTLGISHWVYTASILATYLLLFPEVEAVVLSSFRRYMNNQTLSCALFTLFLLLNLSILSDEATLDKPAVRIRGKALCLRRAVPFLLALSFPLLSGAASSLAKQYAGADQDYASVSAHRAQHAHLIRMAEAIEDKESQIYYLHQSANDGHYQMARLHVSPIRLNRRDFCIAATPDHAFDTYTAIKTPEEWSRELADSYDYVYLDLADEAFASDYSVLFESVEAISSHALYEVVPPQDENGLVLLRLIDRE